MRCKLGGNARPGHAGADNGNVECLAHAVRTRSRNASIRRKRPVAHRVDFAQQFVARLRAERNQLRIRKACGRLADGAEADELVVLGSQQQHRRFDRFEQARLPQIENRTQRRPASSPSCPAPSPARAVRSATTPRRHSARRHGSAARPGRRAARPASRSISTPAGAGRQGGTSDWLRAIAGDAGSDRAEIRASAPKGPAHPA